MSSIRKLVMILITTCGVAIQTAVSDGTITRAEWGELGTLAVGAFLVWFVPNDHDTVPSVPDVKLPAE